MMKKRRTRTTADADAEGLEREQRMLAHTLEGMLKGLENRLMTLGKRVRQTMHGGAGERDASHIRNEQAALWRVVRRLQAANRTTHALEQELREWSSRDGNGRSSADPDHPRTRAEFIASELRSRGKAVDPGLLQEAPHEGSAHDAGRAFEFVTSSSEPADAEAEPPVWMHAEATCLEDEIGSCIREMNRMLAHPDRASLAAELLGFAKQLKELHGHLRVHDRLTGERRNRLMIGM
jgi:hypothetical protein